ncbi:MAG TPA: permease-like cell division protein FtsX [Rudaea sp.]|nr:permease-like cell division protein FtsX [Rudaea sp.]
MNRRKSQNRMKPTAPVRSAVTTRAARPGIRAWRAQHVYGLTTSFGRLTARPIATAFTLAVLSVALTLPLLFGLLLSNAGTLSGSVDQARAISVFLKADVDAGAARQMATQLRERADVAAVELKTPEQGLQEFRQRSGFADALDVLHDNPLPSVLIVKMQNEQANPAQAPALIGELRANPQVDLVQYDARWREWLNAILGVAGRGAAVLAVLLALAALLVVGNTVRLDIQGRREEIAVMQLLGASDGFVRRPFLYTGLWYGLLAGVLCVLLTVLIEWAIATPLTQLAASYDHRFDVHGLSFAGMLAVVAASTLLGWIGAGVAASRHIALGQPQ